jgi:ferredoxin-NADP reductase
MVATCPQTPADLYGRERPDRFIAGLTAIFGAYTRLLAGPPGPPGRPRQLGRLERPGQPGRPDRAPRQRPANPACNRATAWRDLVVAARTTDCAGVVRLRLAAPDGGPLPRWRPGSHLRLDLPSGRTRHYSLCGDPRDLSGFTIAVRRIDGGGGGSVEIHDRVVPGTVMRVFGPRNGFPFAAEPVVLFIAGGIGITPILPMAREAAARKLDWRLVYAGRSLASMPLKDEVAALDPARTEILADSSSGVPDCADLIRRAPAGAAVYCCGPPAMLAGVRAAADAADVRAFHFERFTAPPVVDGRAFEIELRHTGTVLRVPPDRSVLDVLRDLDLPAPYSCKQGFCGLCRQRVLSGRVEHRDRRLTGTQRAEGDMLICVSRASEGERLVLDL